MKYLKMLGLAAFAAMAFTAFVGASTASATTLEITEVTQTQSVTITASLKAETSAILRDTFGFSANTCTSSHAHGNTTVFTGPKVEGEFTPGEAGLSFTNCKNSVTVHNGGNLTVEWIEGTTNGTVYSSNANVTVFSALHGTYITCKTPATGVHIGTLTGVAAGNATLDINATLNCGEHLSSAKWTGTYVITSPHGLGVSP